MRHNKLIILLFIIAIFIRIFGLNNALFSDEINLTVAVIADDLSLHHSPPLTIWILKLFIFIFGFSIIKIRFFLLIFNLLTIYIVYLISKKIYNKKTAFFSFFFFCFSFYSILSSLTIADESLTIFLFVFFFYLYLRYEETKSKLNYILLGIIFGLILLTRYTGILAFIILFLYKLIKSKNLLKTIINLLPIFIIALVVFSIFPVINYNLFLYTVNHLFKSTTGETIPILGKLVILTLWATPLLLGLALLSLSKFNRKDILFWIWIIIGAGFNLFIMPRGDFSRYFMIILPPLIILSAKYLSTIKLNKKYIYMGFISFMIFYIIFIIFNLNSKIIFPHIINNYFNAVKHLNFNFMLPYSISQGSWFGISFLAILIMLIFSLIFFILSFLKKYRKIGLILLVSLGLSYNIFLDGEFLLHLSQPNIDKIIYEMIDYTKEKTLPYPIYSTNKGILDYLYDYEKFPEREEIWKHRIDEKSIDRISNEINRNSGTIIFLDFTAKIKKERLDKIENCILIKTFSDKGKEVGYIYECVKI